MAVFRFFLSRLLLANSVIKPGIHPPRNYDPKVSIILILIQLTHRMLVLASTY